MRILALLVLFFLVSCATPKKNPDAFYSDKYAPSKLHVENNSFVASAMVLNKKDTKIAEKAAYLKLMKDGQRKGYRYFKVTDAGKTSFIGVRYTIRGNLYRKHNGASGVYELSAISRVLRGLPIKKPYVAPKKPVAKPVALPVTAKVKPTTRPKKKPVAPQPKPMADPAPVVEQDLDDGPTVIMAPEDITGSVKKVTPQADFDQIDEVRRQTNSRQLERSPAVSGIPTGVLISNSGPSIY